MRAFSIVCAAKECGGEKVIIELILLPDQFEEKNVFVTEMRRKLVGKHDVGRSLKPP